MGQDVRDMFHDKFKDFRNIDDIIKNSDTLGKYYIDTVAINRVILEREGLKIENIIDSGICTMCNSEILHSYRKEGEEAGRNTAIIGKFVQ